jgi:hypothetical protein
MFLKCLFSSIFFFYSFSYIFNEKRRTKTKIDALKTLGDAFFIVFFIDAKRRQLMSSDIDCQANIFKKKQNMLFTLQNSVTIQSNITYEKISSSNLIKYLLVVKLFKIANSFRFFSF